MRCRFSFYLPLRLNINHQSRRILFIAVVIIRVLIMAPHFTDVENEYSKNKELKKDDVEALLNWANKQPHLPKITELQAILFLQSCYYSNEAAKAAMDTYFTMKTRCPDLFGGKNMSTPAIKTTIENSFGTVLPKKTPEGDTIILLKLMDPNPENFSVIEHIKCFDVFTMLHLYQKGTSEGHIVIVDMKGAALGHLTRAAMAGPAVYKKFMFYVQEAMPLRLKGLHFFNIVPFMDKILALMKPFMKLEILDVLHLHNTVEDMLQFVPLECLPEEYGGSEESTTILHGQQKNVFSNEVDFFKWDGEQVVDEKKRQKKLANLEDVCGIDGTFKKLDID